MLQQDVSVAQLVEQLTLNQWVEGSSPSGYTFKNSRSIATYRTTVFY